MIKNLLPLCMLLLLFVSNSIGQTPPSTEWSDNASTDWYDNLTTEFTISTAEDLAGLAELVAGGNDFTGKTILIGANIDLAAHLWSPIGTEIGLAFSGTFDGNEFEISNLFIVTPGGDLTGLFGRCSNANLSNIHLVDPYVRTNDTAGSLVGSFSMNSNMVNCHAKGVDMVATEYNIGGLVGELLDNSNMTRCSSLGSVTGMNQVGGLLGTPYNLTSVTECYSEGTVNAQYLAGGLIGFSTFAFTANRENTVNNCYSRANVAVVNGRAGGLVGGTDGQMIIENSYATGTATGPEYDGGFIGALGSVETTNNYWDTVSSVHSNAIGGFTAASQTVDITGKTSAEMQASAMVDLLNQNQVTTPWTIDAALNDGYPILADNIASISDVHNSNIDVSVYPTLFSTFINIESDQVLSSYSLMDISGKIVRQGKLSNQSIKLETESIISGTYILIVRSNDLSFVQKVIK